MAKRKKRVAKKNPEISIDGVRQISHKLVTTEKVKEKLLNKKIPLKRRESTTVRAAIKNFQNAHTRSKRANTLLEKHSKTMLKIMKKYSYLID